MALTIRAGYREKEPVRFFRCLILELGPKVDIVMVLP